MHALIERLFPLCRSITGDGVRATLDVIGEHLPLERHEVPSGTQVYDWTVPDEWNVREAWVRAPSGERVVDLARSNLHVVGYSLPVRRSLTLEELRPHLFSLPDRPDLVPYRTAYYSETWGFCLSHRQLEALPPGRYEVCIDATRAPGHLSYGECLIRGEVDDEVLVSTHVCHPSLANDNLSGIAVAVALAGRLLRERPRLSYRLLFIPGTIGAITWLCRNEAATARIRHGLVLTGVGDPGQPTYKRSRRGTAGIDRAMEHVLRASGRPFAVRDFSPWGYDERQYCSPGFDLPVGCFMRTPHGTYPEYHTSGDDLDFVRPESLADSLELVSGAFRLLERNRVLRNTSPKCEPRLGKRGLLSAVGGLSRQEAEMALLWVLNLADGGPDLLAIAERAGLPFDVVADAAGKLLEAGLLAPV